MHIELPHKIFYRMHWKNPLKAQKLLSKYRILLEQELPSRKMNVVGENSFNPLSAAFAPTSDDGESDPDGNATLALDAPAVHVRRKRFSNRKDNLTDPALTSEGGSVEFLKRRLFESMHILTIDIGATRTKFMYQFGATSRILQSIESKELWSQSELTTPLQLGRIFRGRLGEHLHSERLEGRLPLVPGDLDAVIFSVPGTVDLGEGDEGDMCVVRNMPSLSPSFKGFNFKRVFAELFPKAKIYAVADNMAAAMGVASSLQFKSAKCGLVMVLGTAPAVATFFKAPVSEDSNANDAKRKFPPKTVELAIWQSWVWFTKIPLGDAFGYCGGLQTDESGGFKLRAMTDYKIPHPKARIRFAIDASTWKRLRGRLDWLSRHLQGNLSKEDARAVWSARVQSAVNAICLKCHHVYGKPDIVVLLGGNSLKCVGRVSEAEYVDPDFSRSEPLRIPIFVPSSDEEQQLIHMRGLAQAANYKISQVYAHGPDPLARGWTRGGEIYLWARRREIL
jgi:hypothetical protein